MDWIIWAAGAGALVLLIVLALLGIQFAPARAQILIDTAGGTMRADLKTLWGIGPLLTRRALPQAQAGNPLPPFNDPAHIGYALMTPGIADVTYAALQRLIALEPRTARFSLGLNLTDSGQARVVQTAVQAVLATAPPAMRNAISIETCEPLGAEISGRFELDISPSQLGAIYNRFRKTKAAREFGKRLKRKPKQSKKAPREVQA